MAMRALTRKLEGNFLSRQRHRASLYSTQPTHRLAASSGSSEAGKSSGGGGGIFWLLLFGGAGGAGYYYYTHPDQIPRNLVPADFKMPELKLPEIKLALPDSKKTAATLPSPPAVVDPKEEFLKRVESLKVELEDLRKEKVDKFIKLKKKEIKEELKIVQKAIEDLTEPAKK